MWIVPALFLPAAVALVSCVAWAAVVLLRSGSPLLAGLLVAAVAAGLIYAGTRLTRGMQPPPEDDDRQHWP